MSVSSLPKRIVRLHTGSGPDQISLSPTFIRRLDVIVPTGSGIEAHLVGQVPKYTIRSGVRLDDVLSSPEEFRTSSSITSVCEDEAWYIDGQRGILVLKVLKERYQALGIAGKESGDAYIIQVNLKDATTRMYSRTKEALKTWDKDWEVWSTWVANEPEPAQAASAFKNVQPERVVLEDVLVPTVFPGEEIEEDSWVELFEWVGMCSIGSPRISSTDQVNSYVSAYSAPEGSRTGSVTRFRWEGLLSEKFVQRIIQLARDEIKQGLFAFSLASFSHVSTYPPVTRCESCAGIVAAAEWALAEVVAPR